MCNSTLLPKSSEVNCFLGKLPKENKKTRLLFLWYKTNFVHFFSFLLFVFLKTNEINNFEDQKNY